VLVPAFDVVPLPTPEPALAPTPELEDFGENGTDVNGESRCDLDVCLREGVGCVSEDEEGVEAESGGAEEDVRWEGTMMGVTRGGGGHCNM
jgi:hypothetical protein